MILESTFLIDLERESLRSRGGPAHSFLEQHPQEPLYVTFTTAGELACGPRIGRAEWERLLSPFEVLASNREVCWHYGEVYRFLSRNGLLIGANDLWIAAAGRAYGQAVVTRNLEHYKRVPSLEVEAY